MGYFRESPFFNTFAKKQIMATVTLKGSEIHTLGTLPKQESPAPDFTMTRGDLSTASLNDFQGKKLVLNIFPSIDTGTCAQSVRTFNEKAAGWRIPGFYVFLRISLLPNPDSVGPRVLKMWKCSLISKMGILERLTA